MGSRVARAWWWVGALPLGACLPPVGGQGTAGIDTLGLPEPTGSTTGTSAVGEGTTGEGTTGEEPPGESDSTGAPDDGTTTTTGEPPAETTEPGLPQLSISDGPTFDFGPVALGGAASHLLTLTNEGTAPATGLSATVQAPFDVPGGFPGAGRCGASLGPGEACTVEVAFTPTQLGRQAGTLVVDHDGGPSAVRALAGGGAGQSGNLLQNPGGESFGAPPPSWTQQVGTWAASVLPAETAPYAGSGYLFANEGDNNTDLVLEQSVDVGAWASTVDEGALHLSFSGHARALVGGNDEHRIRVHYHDDAGAILQTWTTNYASAGAWQAYDDLRVVPVGTRSVRVELGCRKQNGLYCNAYFDGLDVHVAYP